MRLLVGLLVLLSSSMWTEPAWADPEVGPGNDFFEASDEVWHQTDNDAPAGSIEQAGAQSTYTYQLACGDSDSNLQVDQFDCDTSVIRCGDDDRGLTYHVTAHYPDGSSELVGTHCYLPQEVAEVVQQVDPGLALRAFERVPLPESRVVVQPPDGVTLVGLDTVFSTRAERFTEVVRLLGRRVELDIRPSSYLWHRGDGTTERTTWPGRPWRRGAAIADLLTYVYDDRARVWTRVDTTWSARFRVGDGRWRRVPGTVTIEGEPTRLWVRSASPHLVGATATSDRR